MVSILPSERNPLDVILGQVGQGLSQTLPPAIAGAQERQRGMGAIDQLQAALKDANGDVSKILPALAKAYTLNPNLERSGLGQLYTQMAQKGTASEPVLDVLGQKGGLAANAAQQGAQPTQQAQQPPQQPQQQVSPENKGQGLFLSNFIPQNMGELITPEQKTNMLSDVAKKGGDVAFTRQLIEDYNQGKIGMNELANANVEKEAANVQRMLGFEDQIKKKMDDFLPKDTSESEKNIYYQMIRPALEGNKTFTDAWQEVEEDINNFKDLKDTYINRIPEAGDIGFTPEGEKQLRNSAKPILDKYPLAYNVLEQAYIQKGHSPITPAKILKPLPSNVQNTINKAEDFKDLIYPSNIGSSEFSERLMERNLEIADREQQNQIPKITDELRKNWNEDVSLYNMYADLRKKGWSLININRLFDDMADKFGTRQQKERAALNQNMKIPLRYLKD